jgi:hypothetical protein
MSGNRRYTIDANGFIEAKNRYYGFDICPGYWKALVAQHKFGRICSIDKVLEELEDEGDDLSNWAVDDVPSSFFKKTQDQAVIEVFQEMVAWVNSESQFTSAAKAEFASVADGWLAAFAKVNGMAVVTLEAFASDAKKKVPLPNVCIEFDVDYVDPFEMLRDLRVKFVLSPKRQRAK